MRRAHITIETRRDDVTLGRIVHVVAEYDVHVLATRDGRPDPWASPDHPDRKTIWLTLAVPAGRTQAVIDWINPITVEAR